MANKRFISYTIDLIIVIALIFIIAAIIPSNENIIVLQNELSDQLNDLLTNKIDFSTFINRYSITYHSLMLNSAHINIFSLIILYLYFVLLPLKNKGQTIGKKIMRIKIVSKKENLNKKWLTLRAGLINGIIFTALSIILLYTSSGLSYFLLISLIGLAQIVLIIVNMYILIYRKNSKTIHDKICFTNVIERNGDL